jgi:hypothetical protein
MRVKGSPIPKTKVIDGKRYHLHMVAYGEEDAELKAKMFRTYFASVRTTTMSEAGREFYLINFALQLFLLLLPINIIILPFPILKFS